MGERCQRYAHAVAKAGRASACRIVDKFPLLSSYLYLIKRCILTSYAKGGVSNQLTCPRLGITIGEVGFPLLSTKCPRRSPRTL